MYLRLVFAVLNNDEFSWTKAVAIDVSNRHNGMCRVMVTLLTSIRSSTELLRERFLIRSGISLHWRTTYQSQERVRCKRCVRSEMRYSYPQPRLRGWTFRYVYLCCCCDCIEWIQREILSVNRYVYTFVSNTPYLY